MAIHVFDTSAILKHYHSELGTPRVDQLLAEAGSINIVSRLTAIEIRSALAKKVRHGSLPFGSFQTCISRFESDIASGMLRLIGLKISHYQEAANLLDLHGPSRDLRTLDSMQLAFALDLRSIGLHFDYICADQRLAGIATVEGLTVINPEIP